jgi:hypothetical protein
MREISQRQLRLGLILAILLQLIVVALFFFDIIHDPNHQTGKFIFHHGGDENDYFALAQSLLAGTPISSKYSLGYPLLLIPWIAVFKATTPSAVTQPVAIFCALILFPLAQIIFVSLAVRITHHRTAALISVLLWTLFPVLLYIAMALIHRSELGAIWAVHLPWLQMLSDPPTAFFTLLSFWLLFYTLDATTERKALVGAVLLGVVSGLLLLIRFNSAISLIAIIAVLAWSRRWKSLLIVIGLTFIIFLPQLLYNAVYFGNPFTTGYQVLDQQPLYGLFSVNYPLKVLTGKYALPIWGIAVILGVLIGAGLITLWRRDQRGALVVGIWTVGYLGFFSLYFYSWEGSLSRFLLPVYPALALLIALVIMQTMGRFRPVETTVSSTPQ